MNYIKPMKAKFSALAPTSAILLVLSTAHLPAADQIGEALSNGKVSLNARARYEYVEQTGLRHANAITIRPRLSYTTGSYQGLQAMVEFENVAAIDADGYNQVGLNPGGADRAVVADPEGADLNQAWLSYKSDMFLITGGRQRIVYDSARFVGDVGWRQNMQTFDAATITGNPLDALTVNYGYLWQINRVFGEKSAQGRWTSKSHLLNAAYKVTPNITVTGYTYLLDFDNSPANSSATFGVSLTGSQVIDAEKAIKVNYRLEYAYQTDYADQPLNYSADYYAVEVGYSQAKLNGGFGYEFLGSDDGAKGFATPLATLHGFNGWADLFLATPGNGLKDLYAWLGGSLPYDLGVRLVYHKFRSDELAADLGAEWDIQLSKAINKNWSALVKAADFDSDSTLPDVTKFWTQVEFKF